MPPQIQLPANNFLVDLIPAQARKKVYAGFGAVGFLLGCITLAVAAISQDLPPTWLIILTVVYNFSTPFFSALATANAVPTGGEALEILAAEPGLLGDASLGVPGEPEPTFGHDPSIGEDIETQINDHENDLINVEDPGPEE